MKRIIAIILIFLAGILPDTNTLLISTLLPNIGSPGYFKSGLYAREGSLSMGLGAGLNHSIIMDDYISPLQYKGSGILFKAGLEKVNDSHFNLFEFIYQKNSIEPDIINESSANFYRWNFDFLTGWNIRSPGSQFSLYLGGHFLSTYGALYHQDWYNNSFSHSLVFNIGPSVIVNVKPLEANDNLVLNWAISVPVFDYIVRPSLGSILPEGTVRKGDENSGTFLTGGSFTSLHEYQRIYSNLYLSWLFTNKLNLRIGYQWDFQNYSVNNTYQSANHIFFLGLFYRLNK